MISDRIIQIMNFVEQKKRTSFKEISEHLRIKDRYIRYDIDRINDVLMNLNLPAIKKEEKGKLVFPSGLDIQSILELNDFVFVSQQRISFILLIVLFDVEQLNLRKLSDDFAVSRSSIKNDLASAIQQLKKNDLMLSYDNNAYELKGNCHKRHKMMIEEFKQYIYLYGRKRTTFNGYEEYARKVLQHAFEDVQIKVIVTWCKDFLDELNCVLTDDSFKWYISSIMVTLWYGIKNKPDPFDHSIEEEMVLPQYSMYLQDLENILPHRLNSVKRSSIMRLLMYTRRYDNNKHNLPMLETQGIVQNFIEMMSKEMKLCFDYDAILYDGLINHITPLLGRILDNVEMNEEILSLLSEDAYKVFEVVSKVIRQIDILKNIKNENEIGYLSIHFVASLKRLLDRSNKRVLLVCGLGYGTTTLVRETLLSEYQVEIVDTIPSYKLQSYEQWNEVDVVITTMKIEIECCRRMIQIQPIFTEEDYKKIDALGISRKNIASNYYALQTRLDFLKKSDKERVLEVIRDEFGYSNLSTQRSVCVVSDLLDASVICLVDHVAKWEDAVRQSAALLQNVFAIDERYTQNIMECMDKLGFYAVIDDHFAILHGNQSIGVHQTKLSLLISQTPIHFGNKKTNIVFCLASLDPKEHIPAITSLTNVIRETDFLKNILSHESAQAVYEDLLESQREVDRKYKRYES